MAEDRNSGTHGSHGAVRWLIVAVFGGVIGVIGIQVLYGILVFTWLGRFIGYQMDARAQFGDIFGGVNALFTGLAFAGVIYTIFLQRKELELQRKELRLNREAGERSADAQSKQVERLEEAAELSAISTLVSTYGTVLQPLRDAIHPTLAEIERKKRTLDNPDVNETQKHEASIALKQLQGEIRIQEGEWAGIRRREQELIDELERLVDQRTQNEGTTQKPE